MLRKLLFLLTSSTLGVLIVSACADVVTSVDPTSIRSEATTLATETDVAEIDSSERVFQNNPTTVTLVDVALVFAYFQNPNSTPEQVVEIINTLTNQDLTLADFDSPFPTAADVAEYANPLDRVTLEDLAAFFVVLQGITEPTVVATTIGNLVPGFDPADLIRVPGASTSLDASPSSAPPPASVVGFSSTPVAGSTIDLGAATIGQATTAQTLTISETGTLKLEVGAGSITGTNASDFAITITTAFDIENGGPEVTIDITCTPSDVSTRTATLTFTTNDPNQPTVSYPLSCEGLEAGFGSSPASGTTIDLGTATIGQETTAQTLTISETGNLKLEVGEGIITGTNASEFEIDPDTAFDIENGGAEATINITCTPNGAGTRTATLEFDINDPNQLTVSYPLTCEGVSGVVNTSLDNDPSGNDKETCTLREAIEAINDTATNTFGGCRITDGTIQFDNSLMGETITVDGSALPAITSDVTISGLGEDELTISGDDTYRVFEIAATNSPVVTIEKLTITEGHADSAEGGGILSLSSSMLTINSATVSNSAATNMFQGRGGGISAINVTVSNSTLSGNSSELNGGGIFASSSATVNNYSTLSNNSAGQGGGGIFASSSATVTVQNSIFSGNNANSGGGGGINAPNVTVNSSYFNSNGTTTDGGGIRADTLTVNGSFFFDNSAGANGGAINLSGGSDSTATISFNSFSGNTATLRGGAISNPLGIGTLVLEFNLFGTAVTQPMMGTVNVSPDGPNVNELSDTGTENVPDICNAASGSC